MQTLLQTRLNTLSNPAIASVPPGKPVHSRLFFWWIIPVLLLATALGAIGLDRDAIWNDEFYSIQDAGGPPYGPISPAEIWERVATRNPWHAPGFFIVLAQWGNLVGWSPPILRALALLVGVLGLAWTYRLGHDLISPRAGLYAAVVLGSSAFFVHYLHELRMYTFFVLLTSFTLWVYLRLVDPRRRRGGWLWLGLLVGPVGMLYTHYFSVLPLAAVGLYHLLFVPKNRRWWAILGVLALAGVLFLPWLGELLRGIALAENSDALHERALNAPETVERLLYLFSNGAPLLLLALVAVTVAVLINKRIPVSRPTWMGAGRAAFFALATLVAILLTNAVLEIMHEGRVRYLISVWPLLALVVGFAIAALGRLAPLVAVLWIVLGTAASLSPAFAFAIDGGGQTFPVDEAAQELRDDLLPDDILLQYLPDGLPFWAYARNDEITQFYFNGVAVRPVTGRTTQDPANQAAEQQQEIEQIGSPLRLWLVYDKDRPAVTMPDLMAKLDGLTACRPASETANLRIELYTRLGSCCTPGDARPAVITYEDGVTFTGIEPPSIQNGVLNVVTSWSLSPDTPRDTYSVALHLTDSADTLVAQGDFGLPHLDGACKETPIALNGLPSGNYNLYLIVYRWQDGIRLTGTHADTGESGDRLLLTRVEVP